MGSERCDDLPFCWLQLRDEAALRGLQSSPGHCNSMFQTSFRGFAVAHGARRNNDRGDGDVWTVLYNGGGSDISDSESCLPEGYTATGELSEQCDDLPCCWLHLCDETARSGMVRRSFSIKHPRCALYLFLLIDFDVSSVLNC